jgi:checkpoint serine/threonine-protein kinase
LKGSKLVFVGFFMQMDASADFDSVFKQLLDSNVCANDAKLYVYSAMFFEAKGRLRDAGTIYKLGISKLVFCI